MHEWYVDVGVRGVDCWRQLFNTLFDGYVLTAVPSFLDTMTKVKPWMAFWFTLFVILIELSKMNHPNLRGRRLGICFHRAPAECRKVHYRAMHYFGSFSNANLHNENGRWRPQWLNGETPRQKVRGSAFDRSKNVSGREYE